MTRSAPTGPQAPTASAANERLLAVARNRDRQAFAALFREFAPVIKRYLQNGGMPDAKADDVVQDVMLVVWRRAETFDPTRASAATWIWTIARNKRIDSLRREKHPEPDPADPVLVAAPDAQLDRGIDTARDADRLQVALADLPAEQRHVLDCAYFKDQALSVIAEDAEVPLGTVKSRVRLALERLRGALRGEGS